MIILRLKLELVSDMLIGSEHGERRAMDISRQESHTDVAFLGEVLQSREDVIALFDVCIVAPFVE